MLLFVALIACPSGAPPEVAPPPEPAPVAAPAASAPESECVASCVTARSMQAVAIEKIRDDCRVECGEAPKPPL